MLSAITNSIPSSWNQLSQNAVQWMGKSFQEITNSLQSIPGAFKTNSLVPDLSKNMGSNVSGKKIVFCADGTWQSPENNTNVFKIFQSVLAAPDQIAFYDDGVGSDGVPLEKLAGGAMGVGLFNKIKTGYNTIAKNYKPGDDIFIFGFSRGAYTALSLAGMISVCGLPTGPVDEAFTNKAFEAYRNPAERESILNSLNSYKITSAPIKMVGVWDAVGSLGIPAIFGQIGPRYSFLDTNLHSNISHTYHAVAIDEWRSQFPPTLLKAPANAEQTLEQVWFPGAHGNVGGGSSETGLSDICLNWMIKKAENLGLRMDPNVTNKFPVGLDQALSKFKNSWSILWLWPNLRKVDENASLSNTVAIRAEHNKSYRPKNIKFENAHLAPSYHIEETLHLENATA